MACDNSSVMSLQALATCCGPSLRIAAAAVIMRAVARIYLHVAEREGERGRKPHSESTLPPACIASIADIASSPSGHKICRTSLATLVTFRTPNSALHRRLSSVSPLARSLARSLPSFAGRRAPIPIHTVRTYLHTLETQSMQLFLPIVGYYP